MTDREGAFIVLEGTPGSGVANQYDRLSMRLRSEGYDVLELHFPQFDSESSYFIRQYLNGDFGPQESLSPYTAALFYTLDRFSFVKNIEQALSAGKVVLCDRYTGSNMAQQGTKFTHPEQRRGFFIWLDNLEFQVLGLPRPDQNFVLTVPKTEDEDALTQADVYVDLCTLFPKDFQRVDTQRNDTPLDAELVHDQLWKSITPLLPQQEPVAEVETPVQETPKAEKDYIIPEGLEEHVQKSYVSALDTIMESHRQITDRLERYLTGIGIPNPTATAEHSTRALLPASSKSAFSYVPKTVETNGSHGDDVTTRAVLELEELSPRNEMEIAREILLETSGKNTASAEQKYVKMSYLDKLKTIQDYLVKAKTKDESAQVLDRTTYTFTLTSSFADYVELAANASMTESEGLSPRYGFDVPELLEDAGLADQFEACFDTSFALYSLLQQHGLHDQAQYTTLLGHKLHSKLTFTLRDVLNAKTGPLSGLFNQVIAKIQERHPLISSQITAK